MGLRETIRVAWATGTITVVLLALRVASASALPLWPHAQYVLIPLGIIAGNFAFSFLGVVGIRVTRRVTAERQSAHRLDRQSPQKIPTLLVGAGEAGALVAREIKKRPDLGITAVGFLDDDRAKIGTTIHGIRVWGCIDDLAVFAERLEAQQALVTIADVEPQVLRQIVRRCEAAQITTKILPGLYQVIEEQSGLGRIRDVSIEDLLGRESVSLDMGLVETFLRGKRVLVTGAGGSIGSELCRQVARFGPENIVLVERSEYALFTIHQELLSTHPKLGIVPRICDICDHDRLEAVFQLDKPHVVFHAAAHKHVPLMECNPGEAVKNNVLGTKAVADCSDAHGCEAFVLISTDKAVNPTSIMGATKRVAEMYVQALSARSPTKYVAVRFGNVLGSTGSVIPTFKAQIAAGGPVTVTHREMIRYFMTIPEASQLVMQAAAMGKGGEIFVLDMGEPVKIIDLAHDLIRLSGLVPDVDIKVEFTGMRPGEKLFEELGFNDEQMERTTHPKIHIGRLTSVPWSFIDGKVAGLAGCTESTSLFHVRNALRLVVPEMTLSEAAAPEASPKHQQNSETRELSASPSGRAHLTVELSSTPGQ